MSDFVLEVENLSKHYPLKGGLFDKSRTVKALNGVSFEVRRGEVLAIVGESGCGKTTLAKCLMRLIEPTGGSVKLEGRDILAVSERAYRPARRDMQIVFQNPYASLNPRQRVGQAIAAPMEIHKIGGPVEIGRRVVELLEHVGLQSELADRFPHELSGGQQQRVAIARALAISPKVIILDEPVASLDTSVQAQIINLLTRLQRETNITYILISHNLQLVEHISDRVAVMYMGQIVEMSDRDVLARRRLHPYTQALFAAAPRIRSGAARKAKRALLEGEIPNPLDLPSGCLFQSRCVHRQAVCLQGDVPLRQVAGSLVRCHFAERMLAPEEAPRETLDLQP